MRTFDYQRPSSLREAATLLGAGADVRPLAGGMTLIPAMKLRLSTPERVVDLSGLGELRGIRVSSSGIAVGAMMRHAEVAASAEVRAAIPALAALAGGIGDPQVRNRGTIGGSIANNDPAADYPAAVLALGATVNTTLRSIPASEFFTGMFATALKPDEIITEVVFPLPLAAAYEKFRSNASRYALVGVFVARTAAGARVAVTGAGPGVFRATQLERVLDEKFSAEALAKARFPAEGLSSDLHADAEYRAHLIGVLTQRAVAKITAGSGR
jgi:carbon-monoxide dehydrogenase medium subunit